MTNSVLSRPPAPVRAAILLVTVAVAAALLVVIPVLYWGRAEPYRIDLDVYRIGARMWLEGRPLYGPGFPVTEAGQALPFIYPPIAAALFAPWLAVPATIDGLLLTVASGAAAVAVLVLVRRAIGRPLRGWALAAAVPVVLALDPVRMTLVLGQINLLLLLVVVLDVLGRDDRRWRGVLVGLAAAIKLTPLVFVIWFLVRGDRRAAGVTVASFAAASGIGALLAPSDTVTYWTSLLFRLDPMLGPEGAGNQNLRSLTVRLGLGHATTGVWLALCLAVLVLVVVAARRCVAVGQPVLGMLVVSTGGVLVSPISWSHHWVWCLPLLPVLHAVGPGLLRWTGWVGFAILAVGPYWLLPHDGGRELGWSWWQQLVGASPVLWAVFLLMVVATGTGVVEASRVPARLGSNG